MWNKLNSISEMATYYLERSKVIQGNIANADTPNFVPKDLVFERQLTEQALKLKKTEDKHIDPFPEESKEFKIEELNKYSGYDKNRVNVDEELGKMAETAVMYRTMVQALKKELTKMKISITGR